MTFFHFCNCLILAYAPYFIVYKYSALSEYSTIWKCGQAALAYLLTQFIKMLTLATFYPVLDSAEFNPTYETMKSAVDVMDIIGLHFTMTYSGKGQVRMLSAGLGWAAAHAALNYFVFLLVGARAAGFSWRYLQTAFESNIYLAFYMCLATLVWVYNRQNQTLFYRRLASLLLLYCIGHSLIIQLLSIKFTLYSWHLLATKAALTFVLFVFTLIVYSNVGIPEKSSTSTNRHYE
uniref:BOS complex subunit TMEM147 n=1 Tax=Meloidogyne javanica TaxID=6303 RepID=A0A915MXC1_MELJA